MQEGVFLYTHNVSPYDGGVFHQARPAPQARNPFLLLIGLQAPLLLPLFALIPPSLFPLVTALLYILIDLLCANALIRITESGESGSSRLFTSPRKDMKWDSVAVAAA